MPIKILLHNIEADKPLLSQVTVNALKALKLPAAAVMLFKYFPASELSSPLMLQTLPMWASIVEHVVSWSGDDNADGIDTVALVMEKFRKNYRPAMSAAFMREPAFWVDGPEGYIPSDRKIAHLDREAIGC